MPNYRISDETHERLRRWAVPLSDSRDDVVRRVLDVAEGKAVEVESLHFHARSRLEAAIEGFFALELDHLGRSAWRLTVRDRDADPSVMIPRLAEHIMSTWLEDRQDRGGKDADSSDAG
jgi:hypothetical protein